MAHLHATQQREGQRQCSPNGQTSDTYNHTHKAYVQHNRVFHDVEAAGFGTAAIHIGGNSNRPTVGTCTCWKYSAQLEGNRVRPDN